MARQVLKALKVLPPFELVDYPKNIIVQIRTPGGTVLDLSIPVRLFENEEDYLKDAKEQIQAVQDSMVLAKAAEVRLEEIPQDEFAAKMQMKTIDQID